MITNSKHKQGVTLLSHILIDYLWRVFRQWCTIFRRPGRIFPASPNNFGGLKVVNDSLKSGTELKIWNELSNMQVFKFKNFIFMCIFLSQHLEEKNHKDHP